MTDLSHIDRVVFAGGGNRCFWQAGFWHRVAGETGLMPRQVTSVSAGAALSCLILTHRIEEGLARTREAFARNRANVYWSNLGRDEPVFPHPAMYRQLMLDLLDHDALAQLQAGPDNRIEIARLPEGLPPVVGTLLGFAAYKLEKHLHHPTHPEWGRRVGFRPEFIRARTCQTPEALVDVILASSCTPPLTPLYRIDGQPALDGGLVDNVPVDGLDDAPGETLVLLTRPYEQLPNVPGRVYVQPSRPVPIGSWDYTSPELLKATFEQGQADGEIFLREGTARAGAEDSAAV